MRRLNNLKWDDEHIRSIKDYLKTDEFPENFSKYQRTRMKKQFKTKVMNENGDYVDEWKIKDGYLIYTPKELMVIPKDEIHDVLETAYDDIKMSLGKGFRKFYNTIKTKYLGITSQDTQDFLKIQGDYQITRPVKVTKNDEPMLATYPNQTWIIDNMYLDKYDDENTGEEEKEFELFNPPSKRVVKTTKRYKFLMNTIDVFSKKVWSFALDELTSANSVDKLKMILKESGSQPKRIITDRGAEFSTLFVSFLRQQGITHVYGAPQSATTQAVVERVNRTMRNKIRNLFVRNGNFEWVKFLPDILKNYNNQIHSTTGYSPDELWWNKNTKLTIAQLAKGKEMKINDFSSKEDKIIKVAYKNRSKLERFVENNPVKQFGVGDYVRISLKAFNNKIRALYKGAGLDLKKVNVYYTPRVYQIQSLTRKGSSTTRPIYKLEHIDGTPFEPYLNTAKKVFYGSELYKIDKDTIQPHKIKTNDDGDRINKIVYNTEEKAERQKKNMERREAVEAKKKKAAAAKEVAAAAKEVAAAAKEAAAVAAAAAKKVVKKKPRRVVDRKEEANLYKKQYKERVRKERN
jgi:transposase InsO family protein